MSQSNSPTRSTSKGEVDVWCSASIPVARLYIPALKKIFNMNYQSRVEIDDASETPMSIYLEVRQHALVDRPPFRPAQNRHCSRFISELGPMPGNGPGSSGNGNGPGSCRAMVPVSGNNRDQCSGDQHVAHCGALVPVVGTNRDCCPV